MTFKPFVIQLCISRLQLKSSGILGFNIWVIELLIVLWGISGFILFIISEIKLRQLDIKEFKQQQLNKSFMEAKKNEFKF